ncbi:MAG: hypothetical protein RJA70_2515 [Pseudomonadota bacterium]|jgi:hypothetical protein
MSVVNRHGFAHIYATTVNGARRIWNVERLWKLAHALEPELVEVESLSGIDENIWFTHQEPTLREVVVHAKKIRDADMSYPIILDADGSIMDGAHRLANALLRGIGHVQVVRFKVQPDPDVIERTVSSEPD